MLTVESGNCKESHTSPLCQSHPDTIVAGLNFTKQHGKIFIVAAQYSFLNGFMPRSVNATYLSLVPKKVDAQQVDAQQMSDLCPIACCNLLY